MSKIQKKSPLRSSLMNKKDIDRCTPESLPRDDVRTAYQGDENRGPTKKPKSVLRNKRTKGHRLPAASAKIPIL